MPSAPEPSVPLALSESPAPPAAHLEPEKPEKHEPEQHGKHGKHGKRDKHGGSFHELFRRLAHTTAYLIGTPIAFMVAVGVIIIWALTGPVFHYSDTWQLIINTGTTVVTFLVVFMIQNTQNRDSQAIHLKLDELIHAMKHARNTMVDIENLPDAEIARLQREMRAVCKQRNAEGECGDDDADDDDEDDGDEHFNADGEAGDDRPGAKRGTGSRGPLS